MTGERSKYKIAIILEGKEEQCLFDIVQECGGISDCFEVDFIFADGAGNVVPFLQDYFANPSYEAVVAVYDVDCRAKDLKSPYRNIREQLLSIMGNEDAINAVSFCTNPNILQILLMGCGDPKSIALTSTDKGVNSAIVSRYWPKIRKKQNQKGQQTKSGYDATDWQLAMIKNSYIYEEQPSYAYSDLLENSLKLDVHYEDVVPASNVPSLLKALKDGDVAFFKKISDMSDKD